MSRSSGAVTGKTPLAGVASGDYVFTTSFADVPGCSVSLTPGIWLVVGSMQCAALVNDVGASATGQLVTTGGTATILNSTSQMAATLAVLNGSFSTTMSWPVTVTATTTAKLQAKKSSGTGASFAAGTNTAITAVFVGTVA